MRKYYTDMPHTWQKINRIPLISNVNHIYAQILHRYASYMAKIVGASKITVRYQVTIPPLVRKISNIKIGQTLVFAEEDGKIFLVTQINNG